MNKPSTAYSLEELDAMIYSLLDNEISIRSHESLQKLLKEDTYCRIRYRELAQLHSILDERSSDATNLTQDGHQSVVSIDIVLQRQRKRIIKFSFLSAAALLLLSLGIMYFIQTQPNSPLAQITTSKYSAYTIQYPSKTGKEYKKNTLIPGSTLEISQGTLEMNLSSGVTSIIQAPAVIKVVSENIVEVHSGKAWFKVSAEAKGFTILTPQLEVIDLGTEFGISVDPTTAEEEVHVFKGKVEVITRHKFKNRETLTTGDSRSANMDGRLEVIDSAEGKFLKILPRTLPSVSWDFDHLERSKFTSVEYAVPFKVKNFGSGTGLNQAAGKDGKSAIFTPNSAYIKTDWKGIDSDLPRTIVCWIKCPSHDPVGSVIEWGVPLVTSSKWRVGLNPDVSDEGGVKGALRTEYGNGYIIGSTDLRDGRWHQIISIYDGSGTGGPSSIQLYVDGKKEKISAYLENEISTILDHPKSEPVSIGKKFHGCIDNLRIFQGVMPAKAFADEL